MDLKDLQKKAKKLNIEFTDETTLEKLTEFVDQEEAKIELEKQQAKIKEAELKKAAEDAKKSKLVLKNVDGEDVDQKDYFYPSTNPKTGEVNTNSAPIYFNKVCGFPVDREELVDVFNNIFQKRKGFLFYKLRDKEMYLVIVPLKYAGTVGKSNESEGGDFQKHALSFISEGSVNIESLKMKLSKIAAHGTILREAR